ncbi:unnamed protein product [Rotaria sordida]|uniref:Vesicle tethering protein Uso1/P115-like head domain-containing protein n=1 Tax=Rotaria sordida TaxID=392033 RepID=A0A819N6D8_9BILA|nr:unnamed protein product [Rotaria sordida]CAF3989700.1 unnamed protein product [Rotaria sordida]
MAFWRSGSLFSSSTSSTPAHNNTIAQETIERLCDRLQSATRSEDRRDAVRGLKALSKKCKLEVGTQSMTLLANILRGDRTDLDLIQLVLEALSNIVTYEAGNDDEQTNLPQDITVQFTELYIKNKEHVHAALELIEETDFNVRRSAIRFLSALLTNCTKELQDIILESGPMGVSKLVDLLQDEREVIRNDALLLLQILTRSNANIQKIVAFENGFERLFEILVSEGGSDGVVTVEDCLSVLLNLLQNNASNQSYFREGSYIRRLVGFFELNSIGERRWSAQKVTNVHLLLQIIRTLVSPTNSTQNILACQRTVSQCGLLHRLCVMLTLTTIPADVLAETINTIGDVVRGNTENQQFLGSVMNATGEIQQPVLFNLLYTMVVGEKQSFPLRISILYCLQCYLYKNDFGKSIIVQTLLPQTENAANQYTLGHLLIIGYLSKDVVASWCSGIALAHLIADSQQFKEAILKVVLAVDQAQAGAKTLMEISIDLLQNSSSSFHTRIAVLIFICTWLSNCSLAVQTFLSIQNSISYLISQICAQSIADDREILIQSLCSFALGLCLVFNNNQIPSYTTESLERLINKRIGIDLFQEKLETLSKSECYTKTLQKPQLKLSKTNDMILDYEFARLYKTYESSITRMLTTRHMNSNEKSFIDPISTNMYDQQTSTIMAHYHDLIRKQDQQINTYKQQEKQFIEESNIYKKKTTDLEQKLQEIKDQYSLLKISVKQGPDGNDELRTICEQQRLELEYLRNIVTQQQQQQQHFTLVQPLENGVEQLNLNNNENHNIQNNGRIQAGERAALTARITELQEKVNAFDEKYTAQNDEIARLQLENGVLQEKITNEKRKISILENLENQMQGLIDEKSRLDNEYQKLNIAYQQNLTEQNDLLVLCSTYEDQLKTCKNIIQSAGLTVPNFLLELDNNE